MNFIVLWIVEAFFPDFNFVKFDLHQSSTFLIFKYLSLYFLRLKALLVYFPTTCLLVPTFTSFPWHLSPKAESLWQALDSPPSPLNPSYRGSLATPLSRYTGRAPAHTHSGRILSRKIKRSFEKKYFFFKLHFWIKLDFFFSGHDLKPGGTQQHQSPTNIKPELNCLHNTPVSVHYTLFLPTPIKTVVSAPSTVNLALTTPWRFTPWDLRGRVWRAGGLPNSGGKPSFQRLGSWRCTLMQIKVSFRMLFFHNCASFW